MEIGFGSGSLLAYLKDKGANVSGVEIQPRLLDAAKEAGFVAAESVSDFSNQSFDVIFALDVFEHLSPEELYNVLQLIDSLLVKNGLLIARFPKLPKPSLSLQSIWRSYSQTDAFSSNFGVLSKRHWTICYKRKKGVFFN